MGYYVDTIGEFHLNYHDSHWNYIKNDKPKDYYEKESFLGELNNLKTGEVEDIIIPFLELADIKLLKKNYRYSHKEGNPLKEFLWKTLKEKNIVVK